MVGFSSSTKCISKHNGATSERAYLTLYSFSSISMFIPDWATHRRERQFTSNFMNAIGLFICCSSAITFLYLKWINCPSLLIIPEISCLLNRRGNWFLCSLWYLCAKCSINTHWNHSIGLVVSLLLFLLFLPHSQHLPQRSAPSVKGDLDATVARCLYGCVVSVDQHTFRFPPHPALTATSLVISKLLSDVGFSFQIFCYTVCDMYAQLCFDGHHGYYIYSCSRFLHRLIIYLHPTHV